MPARTAAAWSPPSSPPPSRRTTRRSARAVAQGRRSITPEATEARGLLEDELSGGTPIQTGLHQSARARQRRDQAPHRGGRYLPQRGRSGGPEASPDRQPTAFPAASRNPSASPSRNRRLRARSADHRTSFAPETIVTRRNKHDRTHHISGKINASNSCPAAHNGLVGSSSPPEPSTHSSANRRSLDSDEMAAICRLFRGSNERPAVSDKGRGRRSVMTAA
jgi:hypothetical protein